MEMTQIETQREKRVKNKPKYLRAVARYQIFITYT